MKLEALQWGNLVRITEEARKYAVHPSDETPGQGGCGIAIDYLASKLFRKIKKEGFREYISLASFKVMDGRGHTIIVIRKKLPDFDDTFQQGIKLDPTIQQFRDLYPRLKRLGKQSVFKNNYPEIYNPETLIEDNQFLKILGYEF